MLYVHVNRDGVPSAGDRLSVVVNELEIDRSGVELDNFHRSGRWMPVEGAQRLEICLWTDTIPSGRTASRQSVDLRQR